MKSKTNMIISEKWGSNISNIVEEDDEKINNNEH